MPRNRAPSKAAQALAIPLVLATILTRARDLGLGPKALLGLRRVNHRFLEIVLTYLPRRVWWVWATSSSKSGGRFGLGILPPGRHTPPAKSQRYQIDWFPVVIFFKITAGFPVVLENVPRSIRPHLRTWRRWRERHLDQLQSEDRVSSHADFLRRGETTRFSGQESHQVIVSPPWSVRCVQSKNSLQQKEVRFS